MGGFNGSGTYNRFYDWTTDANNNIDILPDRMDTEDDGFADGLSNCVTRDGQSPPTADLPLGAFKFTNVGNATARNQYPSVAQVQDGGVLWGGTSAGTANAQTISLSPAITAYAAGQRFSFIAGNANTSAATLNVNGVGAKAITKNGTTALVGGEIPASAVVTVVYDGTQFQITNVAISVFDSYSMYQNMGLAASVGSNALTVAIKGKDGNDPSAANPVTLPFRSATASSGDFDTLTLVAATSVTISSGSTLGTANNTAFRFWIVLFNDAGTARMGIINCMSGTTIFPLSACSTASSTAEGGAGAADSALTFYTGTAVTSKAFRVLGYLEYNSGLATAGTYATAPDRMCLLSFDTRMPGLVVQQVRVQTAAVVSGTTNLPSDDTIPQSGEGNAWGALDCTITPVSAANMLKSRVSTMLSNSSAAGNTSLALFQDATAGALSAVTYGAFDADETQPVYLEHAFLANTTSATTLKVRYGGTGGATVTGNGESGSRLLGGVANTFHEVVEISS